MSLSDEHELQVQSYLRFAKLKRDQHVREVASTLSDFKSDRIRKGEIYNYDELNSLFSELDEELRTLIDKEIQNAYHTNGIVLKHVLSQAQAAGLELQVDTQQLENELLLKQMQVSEATALSRPAADFVRRHGQLSKLGTVATVAVEDPQAAKERDSLKAELAAVQERLQKLQEQTTGIMRDKSALNEQVLQLKDQLAAKEAALQAAQQSQGAAAARLQQVAGSSSGEVSALSRQVADMQLEAADLRTELSAARAELASVRAEVTAKDKQLSETSSLLDARLDSSKQFQQLKQMMQAKSKEVVALRKRLAKYEPQTVMDGDAGGEAD